MKPANAPLVKTTAILEISKSSEDVVVFRYDIEEDESFKVGINEIHLGHEGWVDLGMPTQITVSVWPGDKLNEEIST